MRPPIVINERATIPSAAVEMRFARSSGPGGQNVNKVSSKVQLWIDLDEITGLTADELDGVRARLAARLDDRGWLAVSSQATRDQGRNIVDAETKTIEMIRAALRRPKVRRATRPTGASKQRRFEEKKRRSKKRDDRRVSFD